MRVRLCYFKPYLLKPSKLCQPLHVLCQNIHSSYHLLFLLLLSHFSCIRLCATPQTAAHQAPPSLGFSRQEHWSGLPFPFPVHEMKSESELVSDSQRPHGLQPTRLLHPWDFLGKNTGVGCHCLLPFCSYLAPIPDWGSGLPLLIGINQEILCLQPPPVFLPGKSNGQWSLAGCSP